MLFARRAGSPALLGFGIDSFVESLSGLVMIWRFARSDQIESTVQEQRERIAIRLVAASLIVLSLYVASESIRKLYDRESLDRHLAGQVIAAVSLITMPILFVAKRRTAAAIDSPSLAADAKQTLGCVLLSVALLLGSGLNYWLGWRQADPIAGLLIAAFLAREGHKAWKTRHLCCC